MENVRKWMAAFVLLFTTTLYIGCSRPAGPPPGQQSSEPEASSRTEFTQRVENYFEYEPLRSGKASQVRIHLTDLSDGSPVEKAEVKLIVKPDRKSTRLNSSHVEISYAVFCLKKKRLDND